MISSGQFSQEHEMISSGQSSFTSVPLPPPNPWDVGMVFFLLGLMVGVILCHIGL